MTRRRSAHQNGATITSAIANDRTSTPAWISARSVVDRGSVARGVTGASSVPAAAGSLAGVMDAPNPFAPNGAAPAAPGGAESAVADAPGAPDTSVNPDASLASGAPGDAIATPTPTPTPATGELELLDQLEGDLVAVETAIETIERIATEGAGGEQAAAEIRAAVERFAPNDPGTPGTSGSSATPGTPS